MSLRLDKRAGSAELESSLRGAGLEPEMTMLPAGDVEIVGRGPAGRPVLIGVEYKKVPDVLACVRDGRFAEQLRGMRAMYDGPCWLLIEGEFRLSTVMGGPAVLEVKEKRGWETRGGHTYQELVSWLMTMTQRAGVLLWQTRDRAESVAWIRSLYWWWTSKDFEEHQAHLDWYRPPYCPESPFDTKGPSTAQKVAAALLAQGATVDVSGERAKAAAAHFGSVRAMVEADEKAWREVEGIGPKIAKRVVGETR